jgi:hypothetical protein
MPTILGITASQISGRLGGGPVGAYDSLFTVTLTGEAASISFTGMPTAYKHLQLRGISQVNYGANDWGSLQVRFNNDSGGNYTRHFMRGYTTVSGYSNTGDTGIEAGIGRLIGADTNAFGASIIEIPNWQSAKKKTTRSLAGFAAGSSGVGAVAMQHGIWNNTAPIHTVTIRSSNGNFTAGTSFALYGVR